MTVESWDVVEWGKPLQRRIREAPVPVGEQVLLRVSHCGVCHSDLHVQDGYFDLGGGKKLDLGARGLQLPVTLGHEIVGEVVAVGDAAHGVAIGQRYLVNPWLGCGVCALCLAEHDNLCAKGTAIGINLPGGFASHVLVPRPRYLVDIEGLDPASAAPLACSGVTTYAAARKLLPIPKEDWVGVLGCGGLGLTAISMLRALGHERIVACDIDDAKVQAGIARGAQAGCNLGGEDGGKRLVQAAGGQLCGLLDFVGSEATAAMAFACLRKGGRYVVCGLMGGQAKVPVALLALREIRLQGSYVGGPGDLRELVDLVKAGRFALAAVTERPLHEAQASLTALAQGKVVGRQVLLA
jgi:alcohol dehydrogenase, propanol-preferring